MNYESDRKLSLEELKQRNKPQPPAEPIAPPASSHCQMTPQDVDELFGILINLQEQINALCQQNHRLQSTVNSLPTQAELSQINQSLSQIRQTISQVGKRKEHSFSLPRLRLPRLEWSPLWLIIPLGLAVLLVIWFSLGELWNGWIALFP